MHGTNQSKTKDEESVMDSEDHWHDIKNGKMCTIVSLILVISSIYSFY